MPIDLGKGVSDDSSKALVRAVTYSFIMIITDMFKASTWIGKRIVFVGTMLYGIFLIFRSKPQEKKKDKKDE